MVIRHLFHLHPPAHQDSRTSIAYYFFQKENKDEKSVNKALRAIVWQLTDNDVVYRKWVAAACNKPEEFGNSLELWKQLVFQFSTKTEATFFIVLDGIDEAEMSTGHPLIEIIRDISLMFREKRPLSIRLLLTGRPRAFMEIRNDPKIALSSITLGIRNEDDIVKYIDARMDHMEILKRSSHPDIQELRSCIRVKLTGGVGGDFFKLNFMLTEISKKRRRKEIEEVLEHADEDRLDTIAREIDRLNKTLGEEDIQELNDLLGFVITSIKAPTLELLEAVLLVKNGEGSLVPLREQIQDKYSAFLEIASDGTVSITSDAIIDFFRNETFAAKDLTPGRRGAALHEAEVAIIRRFLRNVCDEELFNKFGFEEFFKRKLSNKSACINVNFDRAKVDIVAYCLDAICGEPSDQTACLVNYASYFLVYHLDDVDLDLIAPEPKSYIGSRLIKLFSDEECINAWWAPERMWMYEMWTYEDANVMTIMKWFKDSAVVKGLSGAEKEWLNGLTSNSKPDDDLLRPTAKIMAKRWLRYLNWGLAKSVLWLLGYVNKIKSRIDGSERTALTPYPTEEQILELESWAESELNVTEKDKYWKLQMAFTFVDFRLGKKAVELSLSSCEDEPDSWEPQFCLARAYGQIGEHKKALQVLSSVIEAFREDQTLLEDRRDFFCTEVLHSQGLWSCCINEYDASMAAFAEISNHQPDNYWSVCSMIDTMYKGEKYSDIMALLKNMQHQTNSEGLSRVVALVHEFAYDHVYHLNVIDAGKHSNQWGVLKEIYQISIDAARNHPNKKILTFIRRWYGIALYKFPESEDDRKEAISVWEENVGLASTSKEDFLGPLESPTIDYLASIYLEKAKHEAFGGPLAEHYVAQLLRLCELLPEKSHANFGRLILARLYFLMGKRDNALDAVKWFVKFGLDLLSDEDLANDSDGYYILATSLHFVDDINSLAAWSLLCPLVEETEDQGQQTAIRGQADEIPEQDAADEINRHSGPEEHTPLDVRSGMADNNIISAGEEEGCEETDTREPHYLGEEPGIFSDAENNNQLSASDEDSRSRVPSPSPSFESRVGTLYIRCDGNRYCDRTWTFANDIYVCKDCLKVHLCKYCFDKLQAGTLRDICSRRSVVCEKSHEFLHVPRWNDEEASRIPNGHVKVGENVITITDWVNNMRSQYGLTVGERSDAQIVGNGQDPILHTDGWKPCVGFRVASRHPTGRGLTKTILSHASHPYNQTIFLSPLGFPPRGGYILVATASDLESGVTTPLLKDDNLTGFNGDVDGGNNDRAQIINTKRSRRRNRPDETATSSSSASRDVAPKQLDSEDGNSIKYRTCSWQKTSALLFSEYICLAVMSFPFSYSVLGLVPGLVLTILVAAVVLYTSLIIWEFCLRHPEVRDVCDIGQYLFYDSQLAWYLTAAMFLLNNTFIQGLHCLVGAKYLNVMTNHGACTIIFVAITTIISFICSLPRTFNTLSKLASLSAFFTFISVALATIFAAIQPHPARFTPGPDRGEGGGGGEPVVLLWPAAGTTFIAAMGAFLNISYTFIGQVTLPSFIAEMKNPKEFNKSLYVVTIAEVIVFSIVGSVIYAYTGNQYMTSPAFDSLSNSVHKKISFSFMVPTLVFLGVLYASISARFIFFRLFDGTHHKGNHTVVGWLSWGAILAATWVVAFMIAEVIPFFSDLLSIMSSLFDSFFGFIFWGIAYIRMRGVDYGSDFYRKRGWRGWLGFILNLALIGMGFYFLGPGTYASVESVLLKYQEGNFGSAFSCADNSL
ncbi:conserved hypothetical protein [Histoplasma capsulatum G186AR]|uniref:Uncharacterized protein n=1 Tax=Ajellomyces capsulatus (strain G186AR / H82 / ATCC MYA-2454 / RMSCC 2432) TaxID=447093 RepID=C0NK98_AJECG|nr:uncharacterized protein HCBG_03578 [Histoplasma capsulatum G186AR]EEH08289.1 conserved hypothetical protein [Histoplasma capsulatum G186AR]